MVGVDDRSGAERATRHLIELGHKRIGFLDPWHSVGNDEKREGYEQALSAAGLPFDPTLVVETSGHYATHGYYAMDELMNIAKPPTAAKKAAPAAKKAPAKKAAPAKKVAAKKAPAKKAAAKKAPAKKSAR